MTITNERLRELSIDEWTWASNIEERMAIARELLAARETIESKNRLLPGLIAEGVAIERARAEKAEAELERIKLTGETVAGMQLESCRAEVERLRAELAERNAYRDRGVGCDPR